MDEEPEEDRPGDPVCWLRFVCPRCGQMRENTALTHCPNCGEPVEAGGAHPRDD